MQWSHLCAQVAALLHGCHSTDSVAFWLLVQLSGIHRAWHMGMFDKRIDGLVQAQKLGFCQELCHLYAR